MAKITLRHWKHVRTPAKGTFNETQWQQIVAAKWEKQYIITKTETVDSETYVPEEAKKLLESHANPEIPAGPGNPKKKEEEKTPAGGPKEKTT